MLLKDWAQWYLGTLDAEQSGEGWSKTTTLWRAVFSPVAGEFGSKIPNGVEPPRSLERICHAISRLGQDPEIGQCIHAVTAVYCYGVNEAAAMLGTNTKRVYYLSERGELALRSFLRA